MLFGSILDCVGDDYIVEDNVGMLWRCWNNNPQSRPPLHEIKVQCRLHHVYVVYLSVYLSPPHYHCIVKGAIIYCCFNFLFSIPIFIYLVVFCFVVCYT